MMANYKVDNIYKFKEESEEVVENKRKIKQKLCGFVLFIIGILMPLIFDGDATTSLFTIPLGIGLMVARQQVMMF